MTDVLHDAPLRTGTPAPDFELPSEPDQTLGLGDLRGRPAVLAFSPADCSPVCSDQMVLYQEIRPMFDELNAQIVGISVDGMWCHRAFAQSRNIEYPLLADFEPKGAVSRGFRVYRESEGSASAPSSSSTPVGGPLEPPLADRRQPWRRRPWPW